jgi:TonB-linked SusC/RagA family outer membrane protein
MQIQQFPNAQLQTTKLSGTVKDSISRDAVDQVNVGYGTQPKNDITGVISSLKAEQFNAYPITRIEQDLQGTVSGVQVISPNGQPGFPLSVRIRGANSIIGSNEPLYVIDGYIGGSIESVFPDDIESMEVLKDGAATAIYGSRGSNGVVLITTKVGNEGKMKVDFSSWIGKASMPKYLPLMNAYEFAKTVNTQNYYHSFTDEQLAAIRANGDGTNWQKEVTRSTWVKDYQLKISGGASDVHYLFSINHLDQPGLIINQWYKKTTARINFDVKANEKLFLKFNLTGLFAQSSNNDYQGDFTDPLASAIQWDPTVPVKDSNGNYNLFSQYGTSFINPVAEANNRLSDNNTSNFTGTGLLTYHILKGLIFNSSVTYEGQYQYTPQLFGLQTEEELGKMDGAAINNTRYWSFQNSNYLNYQASFGEHTFILTALYEQQHRENINVLAQSENLSTYSNGYYNLGLGAKQTVSSGYWSDALQSYMGRINYSFRGRYLLSASLRDDGSSHLTKKYSLYPSLAIGWNLDKEPFLENVKSLSALKLRASYGVTGNQTVSPYATINQINQGGTYYYTTAPTTAFRLDTPVSGDLKWENTEQYDIGIDASFFKGRMTFSADAYLKKSKDLLYDMQAPSYYSVKAPYNYYGVSYQSNIGSIENKGIEFSIGGTPLSDSKLKWTTYFTISFNRNKLLNLGRLDSVQVSGIDYLQMGLSLLQVGMPVGEFYGYRFLGTWKISEVKEISNKYGISPISGDAKYTGENADNYYDNGYLMPIGNSQPKYTFGFINELAYGNFTLNLMFQGTHGSQAYSQTIALTYFNFVTGNYGYGNATSKDALNKWTPLHQTDFPTEGDKINSSRYVYNASFIKLKNISLSYRVPEKIFNNAQFRYLEVYVSGQNIITITRFPGFDPEVTNGINAMTQGLELAEVPNPKTFIFGFRLGF